LVDALKSFNPCFGRPLLQQMSFTERTDAGGNRVSILVLVDRFCNGDVNCDGEVNKEDRFNPCFGRPLLQPLTFFLLFTFQVYT
jgi:hypothetical protein